MNENRKEHVFNAQTNRCIFCGTPAEDTPEDDQHCEVDVVTDEALYTLPRGRSQVERRFLC